MPDMQVDKADDAAMQAVASVLVPESQDSAFSFGAPATAGTGLSQDMDQLAIARGGETPADPGTTVDQSQAARRPPPDQPGAARRRRRRRMSENEPGTIPSEPPEIPDNFRNGNQILCPWCSFNTSSTAGLTVHCTRKHAGEELSEEQAVFFSSLGRATCRECSYIRLRRGACNRCKSTALPRRVAAGDSILLPTLEPIAEDDAGMGGHMAQHSPPEQSSQAQGSQGQSSPVQGSQEQNSSAPSSQVQSTHGAAAAALGVPLPGPASHGPPVGPTAAAAASTASHGTAGQRGMAGTANASGAPRPRRPAPMAPGFAHRRVDRDPVTRQRRGATPEIPDGFLEQVRQIRGQPLTHLPKSVCERACAAFSDGLEGTLEGDSTWSVMIECFSKLVFFGMPYGMSPVVELEQRLAHWEASEFTQLLTRILAQAAGKYKDLARRSQMHSTDKLAGKRARRLAKEGARAKGVAGLQGGIKQLTAAEQRLWGSKLLPRSECPRQQRGQEGSTANANAETPVDNGNRESGSANAADSSRPPASGPENPLQGVRFPPMTAPGPSGCRPEIIKEMLAVRKRSVANRLFRLLGRFIDVALAGNLPPVARWILGSNVTFLEKPDTDTPRPIRAGEWLRKVVGKAGLFRHRKAIVKLMVSLGQYGVAIPGGAEALFHAGDAVEQLAATGDMGPIAVIDVDLVNCFGSLEWPAIMEAYDSMLPEMSAWERRITDEACEATLACGDRVKVGRGAGQGEPDGPLKASVTLGFATRKAKDMPNSPLASESVDAWFLDDGRIVTRPLKVDGILRSLDPCLAGAGATRGSRSTHAKIESTVRIFCPPNRANEIAGWDTAYVRETCNIVPLDEPIKYVGGILGTHDQVAEAFQKTCSKVEKLHEAIDVVEDAATELVLKKECADVCKIIYTLRLNGDRIPEDMLQRYSCVLRESVARTLGGDLGDDSWRQATCETKAGGLGIRPAEEVALPAFLASRVSARPAVRQIFQRLETQGLATVEALERVYQERTDAAAARFLNFFPTDDGARSSVQTALQEAVVAAEDWWARLVESGDASPQAPNGGRPVGAALVDEDVGVEESDLRPGALALQKILCGFVDKFRLDALTDHFAAQGLEEDARRLDDLRDTHQDHSWIFSLNPELDVVLPEEEWLIAMRLRLGCRLLSGEHVCRCCGKRVLDVQCYHALCCSMAESTKGHNQVRNTLHAGFSVSDPGAATEVEGLIPSAPDLRPADILTTAAHETSAVAVDVGIKAPHALDAGLDCTETMKQDKLRYYEAHLPELENQGVLYKPATFSSFGRRHPDTTKIMTLAARRAARYRGLSDHRNLLNRWCRSVAAAVWRRAARMVRACLPGDSAMAEFCLTGEQVSEMDVDPIAASTGLIYQ